MIYVLVFAVGVLAGYLVRQWEEREERRWTDRWGGWA